MAMIPNLVGRVVKIEAIQGWPRYLSQVTLVDCEERYSGIAFGQVPQTVKSVLSVEEMGLQEGDEVAMLAFQLAEENAWESEGHTRVSAK